MPNGLAGKKLAKMGYRTYIASMPKREYNKIKSFTKQELIDFYQLKVDCDEPNYIPMGVYDFGVTLYEFGKYDGFNPPKKSVKRFFKDNYLNSYYTDEHDFNVVTADFLEYVIESYKERIQSYYNKMLSPFFTDLPWEVKSEWLKNVKTEYGYPNDFYKFDFSLITENEQTQLYNIIEHVRSFSVEWNRLTPFNLKNEKPEITTSWKFEYGIFELVRIYKSFDWKRNVMIYYGY